MKTLKTFLAVSLLVAGTALADTASEADQKWLEAVKKKAVEGQCQVSTPNETRVSLLKEWSEKNGFTATVAKTDTGFQIEVSKTSNSVAQR